VSTTSDHDNATAPPPDTAQRYVIAQASPEFQDLRKRYRNWVFPVTIGALIWYFAYVLLAAYAPGFMGQKVIGNINIGLILGLLQFVTTFAITAAYIRFAGKVLDPASTAIKHSFEEKGLL